MILSRLSCLLVCVLGLLLSTAVTADNHCDPVRQDQERLSRENELLESRLLGLKAWLGGRPDHRHPVDQLFPVDPLEPLAISQFRKAAADRADMTVSEQPGDCPTLDSAVRDLKREHLRLQRRVDALTIGFLDLPRSQRQILLRIMKAEEEHHLAVRAFSEQVESTPESAVTLASIATARELTGQRLQMLPRVVRSVLPGASMPARTELLALWRLQQQLPPAAPQLDPTLAPHLEPAQLTAWYEVRDSFLRLQFILNEELVRLRSTMLDREGIGELVYLFGKEQGIAKALKMEFAALARQFIDTWQWIVVELPHDPTNPGTRKFRPLFADFLYTLMMLGLFLAAVRGAGLINLGMLRAHDALVERGQARRSLRTLSRIFATLAPVVPWLALWGAILWLGSFMDRSDHPLLLWLLQPAILYVIYRLLAELTDWLVLRVALGAGLYLSGSKATDATQRARRFALAAALPWISVLAVQALIGHSILSISLSILCLAAGYVLLGFLLAPQQQEMVDNALQVLPPWIDRLIEKLRTAPAGWLWLPLLLPLALANFIRDDLNNLLQDFDWYRSFSASMFRLRNAEAQSETDQAVESGKADEDYESWFLNPSLISDKAPFIDCGLLGAIRKPVDLWLADHHQYNTLLLRGERGMGKTSTLQKLAATLTDELSDVTTDFLQIPQGCWHADEIRNLLEEALGLSLEEGPHCLKQLDHEDQTRILIIDDAENLFRASVGGLDGWRYFLSLTNVRMEYLYWIISINQQAYAYLGNVFGGEYQFSSTLQAKRWSQQEIRSLILSRNHVGGMQVTYEDVLLSGRGPDAGSLRSAEQRYFSLLWDACRGNPEVALNLWLDSVTVNGKRVKAGLPRNTSGLTIGKIGDSQQFVYAAVVIHGGLTSEDLCEVTSLPEPVVRHALKAGIEGGFLERLDSGLYTVTASSYQAVIAHLSRKNMLHE